MDNITINENDDGIELVTNIELIKNDLLSM